MVQDNSSSFGTAFTISIEATSRCHNREFRPLIVPIRFRLPLPMRPRRMIWPGRVMSFPLRAKKGGVMVRAGQTEGSVDLARMAGLKPPA